MRRRPPRSTLLPYTTRFRSGNRPACPAATRLAVQVTAQASRKSSRPTFSPAGSCCTNRSEEHTSELQLRQYFVCRLLLDTKKTSTASPATTDLSHNSLRTTP